MHEQCLVEYFDFVWQTAPVDLKASSFTSALSKFSQIQIPACSHQHDAVTSIMKNTDFLMPASQ